MAVDTKDRRLSTGAVGPIPLSYSTVEGIGTQQGRQIAAALYAGDTSTPPPPPTGSGFLTPMRVSRGF